MRAPQEVDKPIAPPLSLPPSIERLAPPPNPPALSAPLEFAPRVEPIVPDAPIERLTVPPAPRELASPVELAPRVAPTVPEAPIERLAVPAAPPVELPPPAALIVPAPLDRLAVPQIERELAPAPNVIVPPPSGSAAAPAEAAPPRIERALPPPTTQPRTAPATSEVAAPATLPDARSVPAAGAELPRLRLGVPGADEDIFRPRQDVLPSGEPGGARIDMEAARKRAREIASEATSTRGILPALPPPPEKKSKESLALEKAIKPDCRTAYAGMGLLAVPALVVSTVGDGGCRW
ncbi:MAG: hypothetical protein ABI900_08670 [Betaproteobacteria bacterium]